MLIRLVPSVFSSPSLKGITEGLEEEKGATLVMRKQTFLSSGASIPPLEPRQMRGCVATTKSHRSLAPPTPTPLELGFECVSHLATSSIKASSFSMCRLSTMLTRRRMTHFRSRDTARSGLEGRSHLERAKVVLLCLILETGYQDPCPLITSRGTHVRKLRPPLGAKARNFPFPSTEPRH